MRTDCPRVMMMCLAVSLGAPDAFAATGSLTIKVTGEDNKPVDIAAVQLWVKTTTGSRAFEFAAYPTDSPGVFRVPQVPPGRYEGMKINRLDFAPGWIMDVQVDADRDTPVVCTLSRGGTIEGYVNDEKGVPVAGIAVVVNSVLCRRDVVTDQAGRFVAEHLTDTGYSISAEPKRDSPYEATSLRGIVYCGTKDVHLVLNPKAEVARPAASAEQGEKPPRDRDLSADELSTASLRSTLLAREALVGKPAPALVVAQWYNGSFWQLNLHKKVVLLDFWGVWCGPCREQLPHIRALAVKYAEQGLVVLGVHTQFGKEDLPSFLSRHDLPYLIAVDYNNKTPDAYRVTGYPTIVLIDKKGILRVFDPRDLEGDIVALLAENQ